MEVARGTVELITIIVIAKIFGGGRGGGGEGPFSDDDEQLKHVLARREAWPSPPPRSCAAFGRLLLRDRPAL